MLICYIAMRIAIAGYRGFVGRALVASFPPDTDWVFINRKCLYTKAMLIGLVSTADVVINLAGYPIAKPWTRRNRHRIRDSRVEVSRTIVAALEESGSRAFFISASGINIYSSVGVHTEDSRAYADNFLAQVVMEWEKVVSLYSGGYAILRFGLIFGTEGGIFPLLRSLITYFGGWWPGRGNQFVPIVHISDVAKAIEMLVNHHKSGVYNIVIPEFVTWKLLIRAMCKVRKRMVFGGIPAWFIERLMGEQSLMFLASISAKPLNIINAGYNFRFSTLDGIVKDLFCQKYRR